MIILAIKVVTLKISVVGGFELGSRSAEIEIA